jgi:hypothetical protein
MKIFFLMRSSIYLRNYESLVRCLAAAGHRVLLGFVKIDDVFPEAQIRLLTEEISGISYTVFPKHVWLWRRPATFARSLQTCVRFLDPRYKDAHKLRERAAGLIPGYVFRIVRMAINGSESRRWKFIHFLRRIERALPLDSVIVNFFREKQPDVFLITPLVDLQAKQLNWLKCAKALGFKSGLCVASWDNLTNKSLIQTEPDAVFVWNEFQRKEASDLHRVPPSKVIVTGAQCYDRLFSHQSSTSKQEFIAKTGLHHEGEYLLYLCSSKFIAPHEVGFIEEWITSLRDSKDARLSKIGVLVRPHPENAADWRNVDFANLGNVAIYPREGANPISADTFDDYYDSIYHSVATVGINTSAMIESGILGKPVFTILAAQFRNTQQGTLHFSHLVEGGLLRIAGSLDEHIGQLNSFFSGRAAHQKRIRQFIQTFVRPHGLEIECTPIFARAVAQLHQKNIPAPEVPGPFNKILDLGIRTVLFPWAAFSYTYKKGSKLISNDRTQVF